MSGKSIMPIDVTMLRIVNGVAFLLPFGDDAFFSHVNLEGPMIEDRPELGPCWLWTGSLSEWGYGLYHIPRTRGTGFAHRYAWEQTNGQITGGLLVCHHCDRPACVNPIHHFLGTNKDNSDDKWSKGRGVPPPLRRGDDHYLRQQPERIIHGERHHNATLTEEQVRLIRERYARGDVSHAQLAEEFGVSRPQITRLMDNTRWTRSDDTYTPPTERRRAHGENSRQSALTEEMVREIRRRYAEGGVSYAMLADEFGVNRPSIGKIVTRRTWSHVD